MDKQELIKALRPEDFGVVNRAQIDAMQEMLDTSGIENLHLALKNWVFDTESMGPMVKHPFVYLSLANGLLVGNANKMYAAKIKCRRDYLDRKFWWGYLMAHERPYRMRALEKLWRRKKISMDELRELLSDMWTDCEMPQTNQDQPMFLFHEAGFTTDNPEGWDKLKTRKWFKLYRGVDYDLELTADGPSWTFSRKTAEFFAYRYGAKGDVFSYRATPAEALAYFTGRDEAEIILDFENASNPNRIKLVEKK